MPCWEAELSVAIGATILSTCMTLKERHVCRDVVLTWTADIRVLRRCCLIDW